MLRQWGWFNVSLFILNKFFVIVSNGRLRLYRYHLIAQPISRTPLLPPRRGRNIDVRLIHEKDEIVRQFPILGVTSDVLQSPCMLTIGER